jgi:hypothetical protein
VITPQEMYYFLFPPIVRIGGRTNGHIRSIGGKVGLHVYHLIFTYDNFPPNWFGLDDQGEDVEPFVLQVKKNKKAKLLSLIPFSQSSTSKSRPHHQPSSITAINIIITIVIAIIIINIIIIRMENISRLF